MISGNDLASSTGAALIEQNKVLYKIQQVLFGEHSVKERLRVHAPLVFLGVALPLDEVFPLAGNRAIPRLVAIADHQKGVVMEGVGDAVFAQIVRKVVVKTGA